METSIFLIHSYPLIRRGLSSLLCEDASLAVVGEAGDTASGIRGIRRLQPDVSVVEFSSDVVNGLLICAMVKMKGVATKIVFVAEDVGGEDIYKAIAAGGEGLLTLRDTSDNLLTSIRATIKGKMLLAQQAQIELQGYLQKQENHAQIKIDGLSSRPLLTDTELQVLQLVAKGMSIRDTGQTLHLSSSTVKNHRQSLFAKLGVSNAPAAVYTAVQRKILSC